MAFNVFPSSPLFQGMQSPLPQQHSLSPLGSIQPLATPHNQSKSCPSHLAPLPDNEADPSYNSNPPPQGGSRSPQASDGGALPRGFPTHYQLGPHTYTDSTGAPRKINEGQYLCACGARLSISSWAKNGKTHEKSKNHLTALGILQDDKHPCPGCGKKMRIDSLRRHVDKGGVSDKCKGVSLTHLRTRARNGVRTPMPNTVPLDESGSPRFHANPLPTSLSDPRSPGTNSIRALEATLAAATLNPSLEPSPYVASVHLPGLGLKITTNVPYVGKSKAPSSPISSRSRYASPLPRLRPTASPRSCRSPFGGAREVYSSPLSGPPSLLPDTPVSLSHSLMWSPSTPYTPMINLGASPHSFETLPSLEDDGLLPPLKNLPGPTEQSVSFGKEPAQGLGLEDTSNAPYTAFNAFDQFCVSAPSPYTSPLPLPVQAPQPDAVLIPQIQVQDVHHFHPQHSDPARKLVPLRMHYGNSQSMQGWTSNHSNEVASGSGHYQTQPTQPTQYPPTDHYQNPSAPMGTRMDAFAMPSAGASDLMAIQNQWTEYDIDEMLSDYNRQMHGY